MSKEIALIQKIEGIESQLREIFTIVSAPLEKMNYMQLRISAYRKIGKATEMIDRLLEIIETEFITIEDDEEVHPSVIFLNKQQDQERNFELREICEAIREIRLLLISYPENYQNDSKGELIETGS